MILALDVGNSQLFGGIFVDNVLQFRFRKASRLSYSSDEYGVFLRNVLRENNFDPDAITNIVISSVVPEANHSINSACIKYLRQRPVMLQAGLKTGLKIKYRNPLEVGADRIADSMGAQQLYPDQNVIIVDFGTATNVSVISAEREYLGGVIAPGLRLSMETLEKNTAKLPTVEIKIPQNVVGRSTIECIQSGIYYAALGMVKEVISRTKETHFSDAQVVVLATGGFSGLFEQQGLFDAIEPDLILIGLHRLLQLNV